MDNHPYGRALKRPRRVGPGGRTVELPPNDWRIEIAERRIIVELDEWLYVFDPTGRQVARFRGTPNEVDLSDELEQNTGGLYGESVMRSFVVVHNHPSVLVEGREMVIPPSPSDFLTAVERDLAALIVVAPGRRYAIRRPEPGWPADESLMREVVRTLRIDIGLVPDEDAQTLADRIRSRVVILRRLHRDGWIDYEETVPAR